MPALTVVLAAQVPPAPLRVDEALPVDLDLRAADPAALIPLDNRDEALVEAARLHWVPLLAPLGEAPSVRIRLPLGPARTPLLLAAAQVLKAQSPNQRLYVAFDAKAVPILDEVAWGAVDGGALVPSDPASRPALTK